MTGFEDGGVCLGREEQSTSSYGVSGRQAFLLGQQGKTETLETKGTACTREVDGTAEAGTAEANTENVF